MEMGLKSSIKILKLPLLILLLLCLKPASRGAANEVRCIESERQALLEFKQGLVEGGDILSSWGSEEEKGECCKWKGITCSNRTGRVIVLDLSGQSMRGNYITPALLELRHLNYLDLSQNSFYGLQMPEFFGSFTKLRHLKLKRTSFIGDVPYQLGNLTNLQTLDLNQHNYRYPFSESGLTIKNLEWLSHLSLISYLDLSGISIITETNEMPEITKLPFLKELHLTNCQLHKVVLFPNSSLPSISVLDLSTNYLTSAFTFPWLFNFTATLKDIDLSFNQLDGPIPDEFGEIIFLQNLVLDDNMLQGGVPKSFGNLSYLTKLYIPDNNLNGLVPLLFQNLSGNIQTTLEYLELASNQLFGALPDITRFSSLQLLALDGNQLNGFLPQILGRPSRLEYLFLSSNEIVGSIPDLRAFPRLKGLFISRNQLERLHESIWKLSKLQILSGSSNLFNFSVTEAHFSNLGSLKSLDLSHNEHLALKLSSHWVPPLQLTELYISYCNVGPHFPQWIRTQKTLLAVDLSYSGIIDTIPNWFWNMSSINYLNLSHNQISGSIPDFSSGVQSAVVDLSYNNFSGPIPSFLFYSQTLQVSKNKFSGSISHLCKLSNELIIEILDLSKNQLTGELPDCWMNKNNLMVLNLANNNFSGKIPYTIGALQVLMTLQLRSNNFIGELPSSLKNCTNLRFIDLGENKLTGNFPAWIGTYLTSLTILSLRLNKFHGELPVTICHLTRIKILDISRNNISGRIPFCFNNFTSLVQKNSSIDSGYITSATSPTLNMYFDDVLVYWKRQESEYRKLGLLKGVDLSSNRLTGTFPEEFSNLRGMVFLNLSRNQLTGKIISNIDQMESLEWLDLSRNQFSGKIPVGLARLHFLSVLDLSNNNLTGEIPSGTQLQSFDPSVYHGNRLCGRPLQECSPDPPGHPSQTDNGKESSVKENDKFITREIYICLAFGFITGFWAVIGTLVLKRSWRLVYFNSLSSIEDWLYVTTVINMNRFTRKFWR